MIARVWWLTEEEIVERTDIASIETIDRDLESFAVEEEEQMGWVYISVTTFHSSFPSFTILKYG